MQKILILELDGSFEDGFKASLEIRNQINTIPIVRVIGFLSANIDLLNLYRQWQRHYSSLEGIFRKLNHSYPEQITNASDKDNAINICREIAQLVELELNKWLNSCETFKPISDEIRASGTDFLLWLQTETIWLKRLPWEKWEILKQAKVAVIPSQYCISPRKSALNKEIRILAIVGYATDLKNLEKDQIILNQLGKDAGAEIVWVKAPNPQQLNNLLREQKWDILYFSGHSSSNEDGKRFEIQLTQKHKLEIPDFSYSLKEATKNGLRLAIFNSCDGIGLSHQLTEQRNIVLPHIIVMREKLPDFISPKFLQYFLQSFIANKSLYDSVYSAQQILHDDYEKDYPCASWLPVICLNPTEDPPTWQSLSKNIKTSQDRKRLLKALAIALSTSTLIVGLRETGALQTLEANSYDQAMKLKLKENPDDRIYVVTLEKNDFEYQDKLGMKRYFVKSNIQASISGEALAKLLNKLTSSQASVIGLDILRPFSANNDYLDLAKQLKKTNNFIAICRNSNDLKEAISPPPELPYDQVGFSNVALDPDRVVRRYLYQAKFPENSPCLPANPQKKSQSLSTFCQYDQYAPSFSLLIAQKYLELQNKGLDCRKLKSGLLEINVGSGNDGKQLKETSQGFYKDRFSQKEAKAGHQIMLNYRKISPSGHSAISGIAQSISLIDVLDPRFNTKLLKDKIVLIGVIEPGSDDFLTPYSSNDKDKVPGVYLHAHAISQILNTMLDNRPSIQFLSSPFEIAWIVIWSLITAFLTWRYKNIFFVAIVVLVSLTGLYFTIFFIAKVWVPVIPAVLVILSTALVSLLQKYYPVQNK